MGLKSHISEKYFKSKVSEKNLVGFTQTTPQGNVIEGYISHETNKYLGSLVITHVNGEPANQFVQSMPKIHFYDRDTVISKDIESECFEKLDGTCLIIYPLKDEKDNIIEIVPKTRIRAVADSNYLELYGKINQDAITDYYKHHDGILLFELYGNLNPHEIEYDTDIDIKLIATYENGTFKARHENFKKSDCVFTVKYENDKWNVNVTSEKFSRFFDEKSYTYPTNRDAINGIYKLLENLNEQYESEYGRLAIEGVVINTRIDGHQKWIKIKPGMGNRDFILYDASIKKEVLKYFDEYGSEILEIYRKDESHHTEFIHRMLREEYSEELIEKNRDKIEDIFIEEWDKRTHKSMNTICEDLIDDYGQKGLDYCIERFNRDYPMKKGQSNDVRKLLEEKMIKYGFSL